MTQKEEPFGREPFPPPVLPIIPMPSMKKSCDYCGTTGRIHFFADLSCDECLACAGFGRTTPPVDRP